MLVKDLFQDANAERQHVQPAILTAVERLVLVVENLVHHVIDTATGHHVDFRLFVIAIPYVLYVGRDGGIHFQEILELVEHQREVILLTIAQQLFEELGKRFHTTEYL